jgi:hypothetical protein
MSTVIRMAAVAALVLAAAGSSTGRAGEAALSQGSSYAVPVVPPSASTGKPSLSLPPAVTAPAPDTCVPALPCGSHLVGEIRKDGAVILQVPALRW